MDDEAWVRRLREVVSSGAEDAEDAEGTQDAEGPERPAGGSPGAADPTRDDLLDAVRALRSEVAAVRSELAAVSEQQARMVDELADAVITRLDQRWARAVQEGPVEQAPEPPGPAEPTDRRSTGPTTLRDQLERAKAYTARRLAE